MTYEETIARLPADVRESVLYYRALANEKKRTNPKHIARRKQYAIENKDKMRYCQYKKDAFRQDLSFDIPKEVFLSLIKEPCYYCGDQTELNGLDRVNNNIGYAEENVVPCCTMCNRAKRDYTQEYFIEWIKRAAEYLKR